MGKYTLNRMPSQSDVTNLPNAHVYECRENQRLYIKDGMHIKASALAFLAETMYSGFWKLELPYLNVWSAESSANSDVNMLLNQLMLDISIWESVRIRGTAHLVPIPLSCSPEEVVGG